jgi:LemA protein
MPEVLAPTCGGLPRALFLVYFPRLFAPQELPAMSTGWIVLGVIVIIVLFAFGAYNRLVALSQRVGQAFADIDVQLKQRHDLIPNLVETVKGYAQHERGTLEDVIKARNSAMSAQGPAQVSAAENQLRVRSGA